jgi:hypothetical protein
VQKTNPQIKALQIKESHKCCDLGSFYFPRHTIVPWWFSFCMPPGKEHDMNCEPFSWQRFDRRQARSILLAAGALALLAAAYSAVAAPPDGADPGLAPWFQSLRQPGTGISCCSISDCRTTDYRTRMDGYEAYIDDKWISVPWEKVLDHMPNPTGRAVVCWTPVRGVMCFVRPDEI